MSKQALAAQGLLIVCGDHRNFNGIETIRRRATHAARDSGFLDEGGEVDFDLLAVPGPTNTLSKEKPGTAAESVNRTIMRSTLLYMAQTYISAHQAEIVIIASHEDCAREGADGFKETHDLLTHLSESAHLLDDLFSNIEVIPIHLWTNEETVREVEVFSSIAELDEFCAQMREHRGHNHD